MARREQSEKKANSINKLRADQPSGFYYYKRAVNLVVCLLARRRNAVLADACRRFIRSMIQSECEWRSQEGPNKKITRAKLQQI